MIDLVRLLFSCIQVITLLIIDQDIYQLQQINIELRGGSIVNDLPPYDLTSNLSLDSPDNELFKLNSINGGVIVPRGTSIVGLDLRKTKIRPKYVPDPENDNIERSALFRITGACYFWQFTMFDADPNGVCYKDYTKTLLFLTSLTINLLALSMQMEQMV